MKLRTIICQDGEVDDQNSLRHFLFYANEVDLKGIILTSSRFHWRGIPDTKACWVNSAAELSGPINAGDFTKPYRWTGEEWMDEVITDYAIDYPNLLNHSPDYPSPDYLRSITKIGNVGYKGEVEEKSDGSKLIYDELLKDDDRPLYLQVWGGTNTIARALMDIENDYKDNADWQEFHKKLTSKIVITTCGEQDETYRTYIAEKWPDIPFVKTVQLGSYAYAWLQMPEGESKDTLRSAFMKENIVNGKSALTKGYCTWKDGIYYPGEKESSQFGTNPNIDTEWFGSKMNLSAGQPYDFLSEGDSPTFFPLLNWGFRTLENFEYGGLAGRYQPNRNEFNTKGECLNILEPVKDTYITKDGQEILTESMWRYVADIQHDFAARVKWASTPVFSEAEHAPELKIKEGLDIQTEAGRTVRIQALVSSNDNQEVKVNFDIYKEIGAEWSDEVRINTADNVAEITIPENAKAGDQLHIIIKAQNHAQYKLTHYQQVIITII